eukprot:6409942-Amphidinium_carterae.1
MLYLGLSEGPAPPPLLAPSSGQHSTVAVKSDLIYEVFLGGTIVPRYLYPTRMVARSIVPS